ncbi:pyruvate dehydrogenase complex dihydrolipoamide acetyltransferase [Hwanghaeella grinnelliae]|uniref:Acetyltransferase component of pyruvate dehydrogenase complex n=1 Tax=Hwanghaeella grinnelliae TaxID=2500179 RepID=A0A3S2Y608_9PROT|nr:pyruvate dehydrogenase complex dihydrolipoamide acetyltransferase [Hwanghaeella grinnelliae]RVU39353.1 pyruvate dehydrogenase complex dihydrolipoamide acetyltransferase [Hwanghaeella grinnelliae]
MPIDILMPALSPTMTEGTLAKWHVKEGDEVSSGDVLAEIETDKATMEVEAVDEGVIAKILIEEGSEGVAVNTAIAILAEEGEDPAEAAKSGGGGGGPAPEAAAEAPKDEPKKESKEEPKEAPKADAKPASAPASGGSRVFASPLAKRIAADAGIDIAAISGSGPHGRVVKADVESAIASGGTKAEAAPAKEAPAAAAKAPAAAAVAPPVISADDPIFQMLPPHEAVPNTNMRKTIAKRLTESARDVPHFNVLADVEIDALLAMRKQLNERDGADYKISVNDMVIKATALALTRVPDCNVAYTDTAVLRFAQVDMAMAVAIDGGLITPIIKDCAAKGLATISKEAKELAGKAREGKLKPEEYQGGTFSISNLGMFGVKSFNSIINAPQGGILSVGAGEQRAVVKDGALAIATVMTLSLAVDHRCIDGAAAAGFMKELKAILQDPIALML